MLSQENILAILRPIAEPITGQSLVDLKWIRDVMLRDQKIALTVVLLHKDDVLQEELGDEIRFRLLEAGIEDVHLRFRQASMHEQQQAGITVNQDEETEQNDSKRTLKGHGIGLEASSILDESAGVKFIAVASGKGGVGKSTVTVQLAKALSRLGYQVGIVDADIYGFSIPTIMEIDELPIIEDGLILPVEHNGVKVMSMSFFIKDNNPVIWRGPMLGKMLRQFIEEVQWGEVDYVLIDMPPGTGDVALDVHQMFPQCREIIVTTPHTAASHVAVRAGIMALQTDQQVIGVIENMSYYQCVGCEDKVYLFGKGGGQALADKLSTTLLAQIPIVPDEPHVDNRHKVELEIEKIYNQLAESITAT
ncbi:Mrp/NBP35 family ATP-binding protein [Paenibacillus turicensis]|uniref:Mrp/NBP35 family ATP-binding protein n=1 Tax=Paenibacillus turicensis TaxID=160487 RepID=UPI003D26E1B8